MPIENHQTDHWLEIVLKKTNKDGTTRVLSKEFKSGYDGYMWYQRMRPQIKRPKVIVQAKNGKKLPLDPNLIQSDTFASYGEGEEVSNEPETQE